MRKSFTPSPSKHSVALRTIDSVTYSYYMNNEFANNPTPRKLNKSTHPSRVRTIPSPTQTPPHGRAFSQKTMKGRSKSVKKQKQKKHIPRQKKMLPAKKKPKCLPFIFPSLSFPSDHRTVSPRKDWLSCFANGYKPIAAVLQSKNWVLWSAIDLLTSARYHIKQFKLHSDGLKRERTAHQLLDQTHKKDRVCLTVTPRLVLQLSDRQYSWLVYEPYDHLLADLIWNKGGFNASYFELLNNTTALKQLIVDLANCLICMQEAGLVLPAIEFERVCYVKGHYCFIDLSGCLSFDQLSSRSLQLSQDPFHLEYLPPQLINLQAYQSNHEFSPRLLELMDSYRVWAADSWRLGVLLLQLVLGMDHKHPDSPFYFSLSREAEGSRKCFLNRLLNIVYSIDTYLRGGQVQQQEIIRYGIKRCLTVVPASRIQPRQLQEMLFEL